MEDFLAFAYSTLVDMEKNYKERKQEILTKWDQSKDLPRKQKKLTRKALSVDWQINEYYGRSLNF